MLRRGQFRRCGRAEPAPPLNGQAAIKELAWQALGWRGRRFSRRDALRASAWQGRVQAGVWHDHRQVGGSRGPNGDMPRSSASRPCGRAEPAPPRGGPSKARGPCGGNPGITRRAFFSEGRTLCVRKKGPTQTGAFHSHRMGSR